ncbi:hypothetical protein K523DRAFT_359186 [Schizophyllum commune Tattone D]|nr:hypothetical protein K523DRAFT_359186 [Schizophyllum commune Tattone D]
MIGGGEDAHGMPRRVEGARARPSRRPITPSRAAPDVGKGTRRRIRQESGGAGLSVGWELGICRARQPHCLGQLWQYYDVNNACPDTPDG